MTLPINITKYDGDFAEPVTPNDIEEIAKEVSESRQNVVFFIRPDGKWAYARYARGSEYPDGSEMAECCPFPLNGGGYTRVNAVDSLNRAITSHVPVPESSTFIYGHITNGEPDNAVASYLANNPIVGTCAITYGKWSKDQGPEDKERGKEYLFQGECTHCGLPHDEHHATYGECPGEAYIDINGGDLDDYKLNGEFICSRQGRDDAYRYCSDLDEPDLDAVCKHCGKTAWEHNTVACQDGSGNHFKDSGAYRRPSS